jgi:hypothetical protein
MGFASTLHLSFGDRVLDFDAAKQDSGTAKLLPLHGSHASLDRPMVLLNQVVEIFGSADPDECFTFGIDGFERGDLICVRRYVACPLSLRRSKEMVAERGI